MWATRMSRTERPPRGRGRTVAGKPRSRTGSRLYRLYGWINGGSPTALELLLGISSAVGLKRPEGALRSRSPGVPKTGATDPCLPLLHIFRDPFCGMITSPAVPPVDFPARCPPSGRGSRTRRSWPSASSASRICSAAVSWVGTGLPPFSCRSQVGVVGSSPRVCASRFLPWSSPFPCGVQNACGSLVRLTSSLGLKTSISLNFFCKPRAVLAKPPVRMPGVRHAIGIDNS